MFGQTWPQNPPERRGSSCSAGCTKNQPRRPILRPILDSQFPPGRVPLGPIKCTKCPLEFLLKRGEEWGLDFGQFFLGTVRVPGWSPTPPLASCHRDTNRAVLGQLLRQFWGQFWARPGWPGPAQEAQKGILTVTEVPIRPTFRAVKPGVPGHSLADCSKAYAWQCRYGRQVAKSGP